MQLVSACIKTELGFVIDTDAVMALDELPRARNSGA